MKRRKEQSLPELSPLELEVMNVVWHLGECSSAEVIEEFSKKRQLAETTIRTVLANIRKKGYLEPVPTVERGFRIKPVVSKREVARRSLKQMLSSLFDGSPREAISFLIKEENIDQTDLDELRSLLDEGRKKGKRK